MRSDRCDFRRSCPDYRVGNCDKCAAFRDEFDEWLNPIIKLAENNLKGENKMDFMDYVVRGGEVCLTGNGQSMPVKLEHIEMSSLEPMRFEGHAVTLSPVDYTKPRDIGIIKELSCGYTSKKVQTPSKTFPGIKAVHFSGPCTVIVWDDKTKTVVRCKDEDIDYEKGFAMAVAKKVFGTNESGSNYYDIFKKYLPKPETPEEETPTEETEIPNVEPAD